MLREGLIYLSQSSTAKKIVTQAPFARSMSQRFVPGETVEALIEAAQKANAAGLKVTANYLGESVHSEEAAHTAASVYQRILDMIAARGLDGNVSLKFTQLGQDIGEEFLLDNLLPILETAKKKDLFIRFDMESSEHTQSTLDDFEKLWTEGWRNIGVVLQSYLFRTAADAERMIELGTRVRLCKGAYVEPPEVAYQKAEEVDENFLRVMRALLSRGNYPAIATHDERMIRATLEHAKTDGVGAERFEFQMLHGVRRDVQQELVDQGYNVRVYIPFGEYWYPYLMRRLAERPANVLFMAGSIVKESPLGFLWPNRKKNVQ
jgi:proline dehydrogenase